MRFTKFTITSYKGIKKLEIDLNRQPFSKVFTLVGLNESGKTSILEAINLFQEDISSNNLHKLIPKGEKISFDGNVSIKAELVVSDEDNKRINNFIKSIGYKESYPIQKFTIDKSYQFKNSSFLRQVNYWDLKINAKEKRKVIEINPDERNDDWIKLVGFIRDNLLPKIIYYPNFLFDFPEKIYFYSEEEENNKLPLEQMRYQDITRDILSAIKPNFTIEKQIIERLSIKNNSNKEALDQTLSMMSGKVSEIVFKAWQKLFTRGNKEITVTHGEETVKSFITPTTDIIRYYLEFKLKEGSNKFFIHERSLGFKWFFSFLLFTEFRKNRNTDSGELLFLLDEPASNLHSTAQKKLLENFGDLISKSTLIYTTHSHHLINPEWLSGAYIVRNKALNYIDEFAFNANQTDIEAIPYRQFVAQNPEQKDYFQPILDACEYQPSLLEKVPFIIITEGKNDYYTLKYMNKVFFQENYSDLNFYPGNGADQNSFIISLYLAWGREFMILLDGDKAGETAKVNYLKQFGKELEERIFTIADIDNSNLNKAMEDLFLESEKLDITKLFDPNSSKFEKSKFNTALQNLLFEKQKTPLGNITIKNFKSLFEFLQQKQQKLSKTVF